MATDQPTWTDAGRASAAALVFKLLCDVSSDLGWALDFLDTQKGRLPESRDAAERYACARTHLKAAMLFEKCVKEPTA